MFKKAFSLLVLFCLFAVPSAFATGGGGGVDLSQVSLDTASPLALTATVLGGLGVIWGIRKVIKLINRS